MRPETVLERPEAKRLDPSAQFALVAAREAWADAGQPRCRPRAVRRRLRHRHRRLWTLLDAWDTLREKGPRRVMPMTVPMLMPNAAAAAVSMHLERARLRPHRRVRVRIQHRVDRQRPRAPPPRPGRRRDRRWHGVRDPPDHGGLVRLDAGAVQAQRRPRARVTSLQRRPRRLRHGRRRRRTGPRDRGARHAHAARRSTRPSSAAAITADSYHITAPEPEGLGASRAVRMALESGRRHRRRRHPHQCARDLDPDRRHRRVQRAAERLRRPGARDPRLGDEGRPPVTCSAAPARSRRSSRSSRCATASRRRRSTSPRRTPRSRCASPAPPMPLGDGPQLAISNSFGFGGHNAVVAFASV